MPSLSKKIDFAIVFSVVNANPNGDPLNENRPRVDYDGFGEVTDVCLRRKTRDRMLEKGISIFVQSENNNLDGEVSLKARAESVVNGLGKGIFDAKAQNKEESAKKACAKWFDVRAFGQLFAFGGKSKEGGVSIGIRGPVTMQSAFSIAPVNVTSTQITKSVSSDGDGTKRGSDTMGVKYRVDKGIYVCYGSMSPQLATRTGFSDDDAQILKEVFPKLFENDASSARPEGSMAVKKVIWWEHSSPAGDCSSAKTHGSLSVDADGNITLAPTAVTPEIIDGF